MSKSSTQKTENSPPKWAEPLLKEGAQHAMDLYNAGIGYTPYMGQTRTGFSDPTLSGMNNALAATGYTGPAVTNQTWQSGPAIQNAKDLIQQLMVARQAKLDEMNKPKPVAPPEKKKQQFEPHGGSGNGPGGLGGSSAGGWGGH
jgi:hypothetical protein